jgi:hypothetical protein
MREYRSGSIVEKLVDPIIPAPQLFPLLGMLTPGTQNLDEPKANG